MNISFFSCPRLHQIPGQESCLSQPSASHQSTHGTHTDIHTHTHKACPEISVLESDSILMTPIKDTSHMFLASLVAHLVKNLNRRSRFNPWVRKIPWKGDRPPIPVFLGFPGGSDSKESACNVGDLGSIPGLERSPGGGHGNPLQYSCLENPRGQRSWAQLTN